MPQAGGVGRALVADDDTDILDLVQAVLVNAGHDVVTATNGAVALERLQSEPFDVVVLDVQMPGMSGLAVLEATDGMVPPRPPVIMLSGLTTFQDRNRGLEAGARAYIAKPFRIQQFLRVVDEVMQRDDDQEADQDDDRSEPSPPRARWH